MSRKPAMGAAALLLWLLGAGAVHVGIGFAVHETIWPRPPWLPEWIAMSKDLFKIPEDVEVEWVEATPSADVNVPDLDQPAEDGPEEAEPEDEDAIALLEKKPEPKPPEALPEPPPPPPAPIPLTQPQPVKPPPPPPPMVAQPVQPVPPPPQPKQQPQKERMKAVEVDDDENVIEEKNEDATYLSDKNRRVKEETRATDTNLDKFSKGKSKPSEESEDTTSEEIGGKEEQIRQLEDAEASTLDAKRKEEASVHNGDSDVAKGVKVGDEGQKGQKGEQGEGGASGQGGKPGALAMRDLQGKGSPGREGATLDPKTPGADEDPEIAVSKDPGGPDKEAGKPGTAGKPGRKGPKLQLEQQDYERIVGHDRAREEVEVAKRSRSHKKGRWEKKLAGIKSSLENFTPEVKPGNQTALGTRAAPFALYLAKMHRQIHELWGFGFLEDLDGKPASNPMNDRSLKVTMEIVLFGDGQVDKVTIVRPSGVLTFDVAAIDTVMSAGPYGDAPDAIRSRDGKVYLHWTFHRNEYQCSNQFADPFILDNPTKGNDKRGLPGPEDETARRKRQSPEKLSREKGSATEGGVVVPRVQREGANSEAARANANLPTPDDPAAESAALKWLSAFEKGDVATMTALSDYPFKSAGTVVASDPAGISAVWKNVLSESPKRRVKDWKLFSAAGYRAVFGHLPPGAADGTAILFLVVRAGGETYTLDVVNRNDLGYKIVGFNL